MALHSIIHVDDGGLGWQREWEEGAIKHNVLCAPCRVLRQLGARTPGPRSDAPGQRILHCLVGLAPRVCYAHGGVEHHAGQLDSPPSASRAREHLEPHLASACLRQR